MRNKKMKRIRQIKLIVPILIASIFLGACGNGKISDSGLANQSTTNQAKSGEAASKPITMEEIPEYSGQPEIAINNNQPDFTDAELTPNSFESYSEQDNLGRSQSAEACIGTDIMPTEERGSIGQVKPSGWHTVKYDNIDGLYLYNRCHLIGYQLTGENANEENLVTGTRSLNVDGMLPYEDEVADYVKETENHVMYRVTPVYEGDNLVASGVQMEGESVEDDGEGICFNVYVYNVQPGIEIDYATGESSPADEGETFAADSKNGTEKSSELSGTYIINKNTRKFHNSDCASVKDIKSQNKKEYTGNRDKLVEQGYDPCGRCKP